MKQKYLIVVMLMMLAAGCKPVNSSELATTSAEDLRLDTIVKEYNDSDTAKVGAQMQTMISEVGINFDQGELLTAASDSEDGALLWVSLSNSRFLNFDKDYEGTVTKTTPEGSYHITYTDKDGKATTASFPTGVVADLITPTENETVSGDTITVTWEPLEEMSNRLMVTVSWSGGGAIGYSYHNIDNTGTYDLDISAMQGTGIIDFVHITSFSAMRGFGETDIEMWNVSRRNVVFTNTTASASGKSVAELSHEDIVDETLNRCAKHCEEGEKTFFFVDDQKYNCCIGEE